MKRSHAEVSRRLVRVNGRLKDSVKRLLRPVAAPLLTRINARVDFQLNKALGADAQGYDSYGTAIAELRDKVDRLEQHLPAVLDTIESRNGADREIAQALDALRADVTRLQDLMREDSGTVVDA